MHRLTLFARCLVALSFVSSAGCGAPLENATTGAMPPSNLSRTRPSTSTAIRHVIVVIQENRSFDDLFATFPGADGQTYGRMSNGKKIALSEVNLKDGDDLGHGYADYTTAYDNGKMDRFDQEHGDDHGKAGTAAYEYVNPSQIKEYWDIAKQYVLADHLFQTQGSGSWTAHQDLIRGGTAIDASQSLIDFPSRKPWGCDAPPITRTSVITLSLKYERLAGPFPCLAYPTMRDLLDAKDVSWKFYSTAVQNNSGGVWNAFDAISAVRYGPEWSTNVTQSSKVIFSDLTNGKLADVSWVVPDYNNSDHPGDHLDFGPSWVGSIVNAVGESRYWPSTAVIVVWDDWGGLYDGVAPPFQDQAGGLGFRVAMLVASPYARTSYVSHTQYEFGSILRFIEDNWDLGRLHTTDTRATSIADCFDFGRAPRKYVPIKTKYPLTFFLRQKPSGKPVDDE